MVVPLTVPPEVARIRRYESPELPQIVTDAPANGLYAPVFSGIQYRIAAPVDDYATAFREATAGMEDAAFACNCILNFLYGDLTGRRIGHLTGPMTFGEIAYQLLNQTLVHVSIVPG